MNLAGPWLKGFDGCKPAKSSQFEHANYLFNKY